MDKYIVWHIEGGLGKNVAATALLRSISERYPGRKIIVVASYPDVFSNNQFAYRVYKIGNTPYFYEDYIKDKDTIVFRNEAYYESSHISKRCHLIETWCNLMDIEYEDQKPSLIFNLAQKRSSYRWSREKPILLIQTNGGPIKSEIPYLWTRDIPFDVSLKIYEKFRKDYHIIQVAREFSPQIPGAEIINYPLSPIELFLLLSVTEKRVLIDSSLQHAAAALDLKSTVIWIGTSPKIFGYPIHDNIIANPPLQNPKLSNSYLFDYSFDGIPYECPYYSIDEMFGNIEQNIISRI